MHELLLLFIFFCTGSSLESVLGEGPQRSGVPLRRALVLGGTTAAAAATDACAGY